MSDQNGYPGETAHAQTKKAHCPETAERRLHPAGRPADDRHRCLLAGDGLIIDMAAEELGVVGRSVRRSLDNLRELAGPTVFEIDEPIGRHRHWYARVSNRCLRPM